jgi:uncharacterized protein
VTHDERSSPRPIDHVKNVVWGLLLGVTMMVFIVSTSRARAAAGAEPADTITGVIAPSVEARPLPFAGTAPRTSLSRAEEGAIVARARLEMDRVSVYDSSWMETSSYPMGDVPESRGACTDVVVRSLRAIGIDLQELVHEDVARAMDAYGASGFDHHIDHRRISTMYTYFARNALSLTTELRDPSAWRAGDIVFVAWQRGRLAPAEHVGIISDTIGVRGLPLVIENGGPRAAETDSLGRGKIVGHFRALQKR